MTVLSLCEIHSQHPATPLCLPQFAKKSVQTNKELKIYYAACFNTYLKHISADIPLSVSPSSFSC